MQWQRPSGLRTDSSGAWLHLMLLPTLVSTHCAGYETTAASMTITLMLLLRHPEWLQRVEAELDAAGLLKTPARRQPRWVVGRTPMTKLLTESV